MHNFKYGDYNSDGTSGEFLEWSAEWDGEGESPFCRTVDYLDAAEVYKESREKLGDSDYFVIPPHPLFETPLRTVTREEIEAGHPDLLLKVNSVCANNSVTRAMCEMLSLTEDVIEGGYSGHTEGEAYFRAVLGCLSNLWD